MTLIAAGIGDAASLPAVTGHATSVTSTSVQLNGVIYPNGLDTFWAFQYGTSSTYGHDTPPVAGGSGTGSSTVATLVRGLRPGTTYHFRLVAVQGEAGVSGDPKGFTGGDVTFKTPGSGSTSRQGTKHARASLRKHALWVVHGEALVPWGCSGPPGARCKGKISLDAGGKIAGKLETLSCGSGTFSAPAGKHDNVTVALAKGCLALVNAAPHHRLGASLKAVFSVGSGNLKTPVTLLG